MALDKKRNPKPIDMENIELYAVGYELPLVTSCDVDVRENDRAIRPYGRDGEVTFTEIAGGMLSMTAVHDDSMRVLADVLTEQNPDRTDQLATFYPAGDVFTHVVRLMKSDDDKRYIRAEFYPYWKTTLQPVTGAPGSFGEFTQAGNCETPVSFNSNKKDLGVAVLTDIVPMTGKSTYNGVIQRTGTFNFYRPTQIPAAAKGYANAGKYALHVELQRRPSGTDNLSDPREEAISLRISQNMIGLAAGTALAAPAAPSIAETTGQGVLEAKYYYYKVSALDQDGETQTVAGVTKQGDLDGAGAGTAIGDMPATAGSKYTLTIADIPGAVKYNVYRAITTTSGAPTDASAYGYIGNVLATDAAVTFEDRGDVTADMTNVAPGTATSENTTGKGKGLVTITDKDIKGTGWTLSDAGYHYWAFVHYLYTYTVVDTDAKIIGDGLDQLGRWQKPDNAAALTWTA